MKLQELRKKSVTLKVCNNLTIEHCNTINSVTMDGSIDY